jgi:DNA-binding HxlR family transcriptional regulator
VLLLTHREPMAKQGLMMNHNESFCPRYQRAVEILGKRWTGLIIKVLLDGPQRFNEIADQIQSVSDRMLSERLKELEAEGVLNRRVYPETPVRIEYRLTEKGQDLAPVIAAIADWGHRWLDPAPALAE